MIRKETQAKLLEYLEKNADYAKGENSFTAEEIFPYPKKPNDYYENKDVRKQHTGEKADVCKRRLEMRRLMETFHKQGYVSIAQHEDKILRYRLGERAFVAIKRSLQEFKDKKLQRTG